MKRTWNLILDEFKITFVSGLVATAAIMLISLLPILAGGSFSERAGISETGAASLSQALLQSVIFTLFVRMFSVLRDKSTFDKNRVAYLTNKPAGVAVSKILPDIIYFILPIVLVLGIAYPVIISKGGTFGDEALVNFVAVIFVILFVYLLASSGMRYINTMNMERTARGLIMTVFVLLTIGITVIGGFTLGILGQQQDSQTAVDIQNFLKDYELVISLVPVLNLITPFMVLYQFIEAWTVVPLICESIIIVGIFWMPLSRRLKSYLTT